MRFSFATNFLRSSTKFVRVAAVSVVFLAAVSWNGSAYATAPSMTMSVDSDGLAPNGSPSAQPSGPFGFMDGISKSGGALGDMWGLRPWLGHYGLTLGIQETSEALGNVKGGIHEGVDYDGLTQMVLQLDTNRAFGWYGGTFNVSGLQIHGRNLSSDNLETLQTASGIESDRSTRLWEAWYQQKFLDQDRLDVKIGQQSLDQEFMTSQNANLFVNTMFGWAMVPSADLPGGGPAYPLSALGVRVRAKPSDAITVLAGVFNGSPANTNSTNPDPQLANRSGTSFPLNGGVLAISEIQYAYPSLGGMVSPSNTSSLSGTYKLGVWYDSENFSDQELDTSSVSLASPGSNGNPLQHRGDYGLYAVADQMLWHSDYVDDRTLNFFTRIMVTPEADRNLIDFSLNAGFTLHEPIFGRDDDTAGIGMGYAHVSHRAAAFDRDSTAFGTPTSSQSGETFIEAMYQYQVTPWWQLQPDFQYVFNVAGGSLNPNTGTRIGNEAILGVRTNILF